MKNLLSAIVENTRQFYRDLKITGQETDLDSSRRWCEAVRRGCIFFYDKREVEIGLQDIDWSGRHIQHQEWPAQLNRFFCLHHLAECYDDSHDPELPRLARALIEDWIKQHDYNAESALAPGDNTLNLSIRLGQTRGWGWWPAAARFNCPEVFDEEFLKQMLESTRGQLALLRNRMSVHGNWRISQLDTFITMALLLPDMDAHLEFAVRNLNEAFNRQIHADGSHEEHNPSYHAWMCNVFTAYWRLGRARPELGLRIDSERMLKMWDYRLFSSAPDGDSAGLHDGSRGMRNPPGLAGLRKQRRTIINEAGVEIQQDDEVARPSRFFPAAGQIFLRTSMLEDADMFTFDATRWGGGHCHLSRNAVSFFSGGRMLLVDPGVFTYEVSDPFMAYGKSTAAHNTLNIDRMNQTDANPDPRVVLDSPAASLVSCVYEGGYYPGTYTWGWHEGRHPGVFARHNRTLFWLKNEYALVWDWLQTDTPYRYHIHWQFPAGPAGSDKAAARAWSATPDSRNVLVQRLTATAPTECALYEGSHSPRLGWLPADAAGERVPAPMFVLSGLSCGLPAELALIQPFDGTEPPPVSVTPLPGSGREICAVAINWPDGTVDIAASTFQLGQQIGLLGQIETDMAMIWLRLRDDKPVRAAGFGGLYLDYTGRNIVNREQPDFWETVFHPGQ